MRPRVPAQAAPRQARGTAQRHDRDRDRGADRDLAPRLLLTQSARPSLRPAALPDPLARAQNAPDEIVVVGLSEGDAAALTARGFRVLHRRALSGGTTVTRLVIPGGTDLPVALAQVRALPTGGGADLNHFYRPADAADPQACPGADCLAHAMLDWHPVIAGGGCGGTAPLVGMIDTGLDPRHPALRGAQLDLHRLGDTDPVAAAPEAAGDDALLPAAARMPGTGDQGDHLHGTAVAALLVGAAGSASPGLLPHLPLLAVDAFAPDAAGDPRTDVVALIEAMDWLAARGVRVINLSLAGPPNAALAGRVAALDAEGILLVAAAGNAGPAAPPQYPAAYDTVLAVTAVDSRGQVYRRAVRGPQIDLAAPGVDVPTAGGDATGATHSSGTSFAAPFVTAAAAMLLQADPSLSPAQVRARLRADARDLGEPGPDAVFGAGLVSLAHACERRPAPAPETLTAVVETAVN